ncbi:hypothetical protein UVI_02003520 [Ustilaginoidea virens]|uniref:Oxo-4-hydroxy-4-carboxy-5-ureidoimidazoline decarboxylase domain-containing protein n=1 Tax=Ustilaginoidea virens TaxID=1159556 RepID=A0A1B5L100_USTVR|nr:hypothetical protein UVI_02003520 [Ustilaginoidea virens]
MYSTYPELIDQCRVALFDLAAKSTPDNPDPTLLSVVGSHPRLGAKKVDSAQSAAEQANLQGQGEQLAELNREYEEKFPGLRFVVFVNGRGRPEIMHDMRVRIDRGDFSKEIDAALQPIDTFKPAAKISGKRLIAAYVPYRDENDFHWLKHWSDTKVVWGIQWDRRLQVPACFTEVYKDDATPRDFETGQLLLGTAYLEAGML